jgi:hypothetical protein
MWNIYIYLYTEMWNGKNMISTLYIYICVCRYKKKKTTCEAMKHDRHMWNNLFSTYDRQRCMNNTHEHQISSNWEIWQGARLCDGKTYSADPQKLWHKVRRGMSLKVKATTVVQPAKISSWSTGFSPSRKWTASKHSATCHPWLSNLLGKWSGERMHQRAIN